VTLQDVDALCITQYESTTMTTRHLSFHFGRDGLVDLRELHLVPRLLAINHLIGLPPPTIHRRSLVTT
jgi:hypothetical protein